MSLLGLEKSLKFTTLYTPSFFCKITRIILPRRIWLILGVQEPVKLTGNVKTFFVHERYFILFYFILFLYLDQMQLQVIPSHSFCGK